MVMSEQLIVPFDKPRLKSGIIVCLVMLCVYLGFYILVENLKPTLGYLLVGVIQAIIALVSLFFLLITCYSLHLLIVGRKVAELNEKGIWVNGYGFIPWNEIDEFYTYYPKGPVEIIGICVKDLSKLSNQVSFFVRVGIPVAKFFKRRPHITISSIAIDNQVVVDFAKRHMKR